MAVAYPAETLAAQRPKLVAHVVPWFMTPAKTGRWAFRWTLNENNGDEWFNPDNFLSNGQRRIASYQYPLTGPYDSSAENLLYYQVSLMKMAGIEGCVIYWHGTSNYPGDEYNQIRQATHELVNMLKRADMDYAICYEDYVLYRLMSEGKLTEGELVEQARRDFAYLEENHFSDPNYIKHNGRLVVLAFFPSQDKVTLGSMGEWNQVFSGLTNKPLLVSMLGSLPDAEAEFSWVADSGNSDRFSGAALRAKVDAYFGHFFNYRKGSYSAASCFPSFNDKIFNELRYADGRQKSNGAHGVYEYENGETFKYTFDKAVGESNSNLVQIVTWNDYAEGTAIEPSVNRDGGTPRGYTALEHIQNYSRQFPEFPQFTALDLRAPIEIYRAAISGNMTQRLNAKNAFEAILRGDAAGYRTLAASAGAVWTDSTAVIMPPYDVDTEAAAAKSVTVISNAGGTVEADKTTADAGDAITVTITSQAGYQLSSVSIYKTGDASASVPFNATAETDTSYFCEFTMPDYSVTVDVQFYQPTGGSAVFPNFNTTTLNGAPVTQNIFSRAKLTVVKFWAPWCAPCSAELYDLGKLGNSMPAGTQLVGVLVSSSNEEIAEAKQMLSKSNSNFTQILYQSEMREVYEGFVPMTLFVDSSGNIVGDRSYGAHAYAIYLADIERRLAAMGEYSGPARYAVCTPLGGLDDWDFHGKVRTDKALAAPGESVTITLEPDAGWAAYDLKVVTLEGTVIAKGDYAWNPSPSLTFTMPASDVYVRLGYTRWEGDGHGEEWDDFYEEDSVGGCSVAGLGGIAMLGAVAALIKKKR